MLKQLVNECVIDLTITPDGPILIKSGLPSISGPDMAFVTTWRNGRREVYLPGSSLKGVLRSHAERITRTLNEAAACNPFAEAEKPNAFCGDSFEKRKKDAERKKDNSLWPNKEHHSEINQLVYRESCLICRLFGSTWHAGRLATADAYAVGQPPKPQQRDGVGIDRFTGGAAQGVKFDLEVVTEGLFETQLHLRNFELWQLGLLGFVLSDLADGLIRIGAAKSRGLGRVRGTVKQVRLDLLGGKANERLSGVGSLINKDMAASYGLEADELNIPLPKAQTSNGLRTTYLFEGTAFPWEALKPKWVERVNAYQMPEEMRVYRSGRPT